MRRFIPMLLCVAACPQERSRAAEPAVPAASTPSPSRDRLRPQQPTVRAPYDEAKARDAAAKLPPFDDPVAAIVAAESRRGVDSPEALARMLLNKANAPLVEVAWLLEEAGDFPTLREVSVPLAKAEPTNMIAVEQAGQALIAMREHREAAALLEEVAGARARIPDEAGRVTFAEKILPMRCEAFFVDARSNAQAACDEAIKTSRLSTAYRIRGRIALASNDFDTAHTYLQAALSMYMRSGESWYWLGVAQSLKGDAEGAKSAWRESVEVWPDFVPALRALKSGEVELATAVADAEGHARRVAARQLGRCGRIYLTLGITERAERCLAAANALDAGSGDAYRFIQLAAARPKEALATRPPTKGGHPALLAAMAELRVAKDPDAAISLLTRAFEEDPGSSDVNLALVHACVGQKKGPCAGDPFARLRSPSQRRETGGWGLANQLDSRFIGYVPPRLTHFELQPVLEGEAPELEGVVEALEKRFPGATFTLNAPLATPDGAVDRRREQVISEYLMPKLPRRKGLVAILDRDLGSVHGNFLYGNMELETVRGVVSMSRFRMLEGGPTEPHTPSGTDLRRSRQRLQNQLASTIAKLLGASFPCRNAPCVLQFPRNMDDFDAKGGDFCQKHRSELEDLLH